jgi:hypothetical protein
MYTPYCLSYYFVSSHSIWYHANSLYPPFYLFSPLFLSDHCSLIQTTSFKFSKFGFSFLLQHDKIAEVTIHMYCCVVNLNVLVHCQCCNMSSSCCQALGTLHNCITQKGVRGRTFVNAYIHGTRDIQIELVITNK